MRITGFWWNAGGSGFVRLARHSASCGRRTLPRPRDTDPFSASACSRHNPFSYRNRRAPRCRQRRQLVRRTACFTIGVLCSLLLFGTRVALAPHPPLPTFPHLPQAKLPSPSFPPWPGGPGPTTEPFGQTTRGHHTGFLTPPRPSTVEPLSGTVRSEILTAARLTGLPAALLSAVVQVESRGHVFAISSAGAKGLMQLEPRTAASLGVRNIFNPAQNTRAGAQYLAGLLTLYSGDQEDCVRDPEACPAALALALAAYNAGPGTVARYGGIPPYPETQRYIRLVIQLYLHNLQHAKP